MPSNTVPNFKFVLLAVFKIFRLKVAKKRIFGHFQPTFRVEISHNSSEGRGRALKLGRMLPKCPPYLIANFQNFAIFRNEMTVTTLSKCITGTRLDRRADPTPNPIEKIISVK